MQQLPTTLRPAVHCGKDTTRKTLLAMCNALAWLQQCWKSCANEFNIVALRLDDHGTNEMLILTSFKLCTTSPNNTQQHTICNRMCKRTQHVTSHNAGSCWPKLRLFVWGFTWKLDAAGKYNREEKSLRHVAMVAKFLDDNKPKAFQTSSIFFNFIEFVKRWRNFLELNSKGPCLGLEKEKHFCVVFTYL